MQLVLAARVSLKRGDFQIFRVSNPVKINFGVWINVTSVFFD